MKRFLKRLISRFVCAAVIVVFVMQTSFGLYIDLLVAFVIVTIAVYAEKLNSGGVVV
jgi:hypothetical protein